MKTIRYKWETLMQKLMSKDYRFEPIEEFEYPIYKRSTSNGCVVEFTGKTTGMVVIDTEASRRIGVGECIGYKSNRWVSHTYEKTWEDYDYVETISYYRWERLSSKGKILVSDFMTDKYAEEFKYEKEGWRKIESSKRTWEDR